MIFVVALVGALSGAKAIIDKADAEYMVRLGWAIAIGSIALYQLISALLGSEAIKNFNYALVKRLGCGTADCGVGGALVTLISGIGLIFAGGMIIGGFVGLLINHFRKAG